MDLSKDINNVTSILESIPIDIIVIGNGKYIINQYPSKNNSILENGKLFLVTNSNEISMPDMSNWSLNEVKTYCNLIDLNLEYSGYGYVTNQSIAPNTLIDLANMTLSIQLE